MDDVISSRPKFNGRRRGGGNSNAGRNNQRNGNGRSSNSPYSRPSGGSNQAINEVGKILVSNLHYAVSEHDLKELFSQVGPVRSASLIFDSRGQSQGSGIVVFNRGPDAMKAVKQFNGVTLDNRAMRIAIPVTPDTTQNRPVSSRIGPTNTNNSGRERNPRNNGGRNNGRNGGNRRNKSEPRPAKTVEDLDAELDAYLAAPEETTVAMEE